MEVKKTEEIEGISIEELRKVLELKGLDIKELAQEAKQIKEEEKIEKKIPPATKSGNNKPVFELALVNYPDFVIRKSSAKTEKLMVFMVSQNSYYIKSVKSGEEKKEVINRDNYAQFTSGMEPIDLSKDFWIEKIYSGKEFWDQVWIMLKEPAIVKAIVGKYFIKWKERSPYYYEKHVQIPYDAAEMYTAIPAVLKFCSEMTELRFNLYDCWQTIQKIQKIFGIENTKDFIAEANRSLVSNLRCRIPSDLSNVKIKYSSFRDYVLYTSVKLGYADNLSGFLVEWCDTLEMQKRIYGKIKDKYPQHLPEVHNQLSYKYRLMKDKIDKNLFTKRSKETSKFEANIDEYVFIAPREPQDFYDEATQQSNCLAGYVNRYAEGKDHIIFMRYSKTPEESLVTIELDLEGNLIQACQANNRRITEEQEKIINKWLSKVVKTAITTTAA